jgi:TonB family protein
MRLDPARLAPEKLPRHEVGAGRWLILSLLLHSLPLLSLVGWRATPPEIPGPIPVQLVIEQPPPTPVPAAPKPAPDPPHVPIASDDFGPVAAAEARPGAAEAAPVSGGPEPPVDAHFAAPEPPLPNVVPVQRPNPAIAPAPPSTPEIDMAALTPPAHPKRPPQRQPTAPEMSLPMSSGWPLPLHQSDAHPPQRLASLIGPPAVRDEYCARALNLTLRHLDQLPLSSLGGRRGRTVVSIRILGDGTINSVAITQSSGYPDIDQRVQKMIFAVGQYPPLPPRIPGSWADFTFAMVFPDPRQR